MDDFDKLFDAPLDITFEGEKGDKGEKGEAAVLPKPKDLVKTELLVVIHASGV